MAAHRSRRWFRVVLILVLALLALAWWFPARWAWHWVRGDFPTVHARHVSGSVWDGSATELVVNGQRLGNLHWTLSRMAVFGQERGTVDVHGAGVKASGHIARAGDGAVLVDHMAFSVPMTRLKVVWPAGTTLGGTLQGRIDKLRLVDGWPATLDARVDWNSAKATAHGRQVVLGAFRSHWTTRSGSVIHGELVDKGEGPVKLRGRFTATVLGWRLRATMHQRGTDPGLRRFLRRFGQRMADGGVRVERHGGLALSPATEAPR